MDKTPLSLWVMSLSVRLFGLSSWSILVPQALMGVATTYLVYRVLRRGFGPRTALFGAAVYATTPVVVLMSRFNNPEPLMGLLTVASVFVALKAMESGRLRSFALAGLLLGLGFMAKQVQAFLVLPALGVAVLAFSHGHIPHRIRQLLVAGGTLLATSAAWLVTVDLIPAAQRPYIGGSLGNSAVELTMDYNGLARFIHIPMNAQGGRATAQDDVSAGADGLRRLFNGNFAPEIGWLLFTGIVCCVVILVLNRSLELTARQRNVATIACLWFTSVLVVLASMGTMIHTYYTYSLAGPLALVVAIGFSTLWKQRQRMAVRAVGAVLIGASAYMALRVMEYSQEWPLWSRLLVGLAGTGGALLWLSPRHSSRMPKATAALLLGCLLLGPSGTALFTIGTPQQGTNPQSGPVGDDPASMSRLLLDVKAGQPPWAQQIAFGAPPSEAVLDVLRNHSTGQQWAAATYSAQNAARYQLEAGRPVIPLGGWLGTDPAPTLEQFQGLVAQHRVGYFIWQQDLLERGELSAETRGITEWVRANFTEQVVDGVHLYDLRG